MAREADWAATTASIWQANAAKLEAQLEPVDEPLLAMAELRPGQAVVDVGCGRGVTARRAAATVGPGGGRVLAVDISTTLVDEARTLTAPDTPIEWVVSDAQTHDFTGTHADVVLSRFGVMFFKDPVAAFANLRTALRPGGRLVAAVWEQRDRSPYHMRTIGVALAAAERLGVTIDPGPPDTGPNSLGDADRVRAILTEAGWNDPAYQPVMLPLYVGGPGTSPGEAADLRLAIGSLHDALGEQPAAVVDAVRAAVEAEFATCWDGIGVRLEAAMAYVRATA